MRVFLSWSKPRSREVAEALRDWLPLVLQRVEPWMSAADLEAGVRWGPMLSEQLETTSFGIICVTPENQHEPWLHFEAGAVSKKVTHPASRVIPLGFDIDKSAMPGPLQQFQAVNADEAGISGIVRSLHACLTEKLPDERLLKRTLEKWLPDLMETLGKIKPLEERPAEPKVDTTDAIKEMLLMMRQMSRELCEPRPSLPVFRLYFSGEVSERVPFDKVKDLLRPCGLMHFAKVSDNKLDVAMECVNSETAMDVMLKNLGITGVLVRPSPAGSV
jgi:hypothetical protein